MKPSATAEESRRKACGSPGLRLGAIANFLELAVDLAGAGAVFDDAGDASSFMEAADEATDIAASASPWFSPKKFDRHMDVGDLLVASGKFYPVAMDRTSVLLGADGRFDDAMRYARLAFEADLFDSHEILLGGKRDSEATEGSDDLAVARRRIGRAGVRLVLGEFMHGCKGSKYVEAINLATEVLVGGKGLLPACLLEGEGKRRLFAVSGGNGQIELPEHQHDDGLEVA